MKLLRCYNGRISERGDGESKKNVRKIKLNFAVLVVVIVGLIEGGEAGLPLNKPCGDVDCPALEYCRKVDHICDACVNICEPGNNYDENRCVEDCQDYIHDVRYLKLQNSTFLELQRAEMEEKYKKLEDDVFTLKIVVCICVAVIVLVVAVLVTFLAYFWKLLHPTEPSNPEEKPKIGSNKTSAPSNTVELPIVYNNRYGVTTPTHETSANSALSTSPAETSISTFTPIVPPSYNGGRKLSEAGTLRDSPETVTTTLTSNASTMAGNEFRSKMNGGMATSPAKSVAGPPKTNKFRREPSESTLPDHCAYDNLSMSPVHQIHYSHHV